MSKRPTLRVSRDQRDGINPALVAALRSDVHYEPGLVVAEGVTMYLPREAMRATLDVVAARSAPKSRLVLTYVDPAYATIPRALIPLTRVVFDTIGEPLVGILPTAEMHDELDARGFVVASDTTSREWQLDHAVVESPVVRLEERVAVADRR